jgi:hypothetical protein
MNDQDEKPRIYLSFSARDEAAVAKVRHALLDGGCVVVTASDAEAHSSWFSHFKLAMEETDAMVLIASPEMVASPNTAFEYGAAMAWGKPVYTIGAMKLLPEYLRQTRVVSLARLDELVRELKHEAEPLTESERRILTEVYVDLGVPTDKLFMEPEASAQLVDEFNRRSRSNAGLNRLIRELLRLRKVGALPKLGRRAASKLPDAYPIISATRRRRSAWLGSSAD